MPASAADPEAIVPVSALAPGDLDDPLAAVLLAVFNADPADLVRLAEILLADGATRLLLAEEGGIYLELLKELVVESKAAMDKKQRDREVKILSRLTRLRGDRDEVAQDRKVQSELERGREVEVAAVDEAAAEKTSEEDEEGGVRPVQDPRANRTEDTGEGEGDREESAVAYLLDRKGARYPVELGQPLVVGRSKKKCQVVVSHPKVSREHAKLVAVDENHVVLILLSYSNSVTVNSEKMLLAEAEDDQGGDVGDHGEGTEKGLKVTLLDGDVIEVAGETFEFKMEGAEQSADDGSSMKEEEDARHPDHPGSPVKFSSTPPPGLIQPVPVYPNGVAAHGKAAAARAISPTNDFGHAFSIDPRSYRGPLPARVASQASGGSTGRRRKHQEDAADGSQVGGSSERKPITPGYRFRSQPTSVTRGGRSAKYSAPKARDLEREQRPHLSRRDASAATVTEKKLPSGSSSVGAGGDAASTFKVKAMVHQDNKDTNEEDVSHLSVSSRLMASSAEESSQRQAELEALLAAAAESKTNSKTPGAAKAVKDANNNTSDDVDDEDYDTDVATVVKSEPVKQTSDLGFASTDIRYRDFSRPLSEKQSVVLQPPSEFLPKPTRSPSPKKKKSAKKSAKKAADDKLTGRCMQGTPMPSSTGVFFHHYPRSASKQNPTAFSVARPPPPPMHPPYASTSRSGSAHRERPPRSRSGSKGRRVYAGGDVIVEKERYL